MVRVVAVRRSPRGAQAGDGAGRAGDVFDQHRLPQRPPHVLGENPRQHVGRPAGRERHDQRDGTRRKASAPEPPTGHAAAAPTAALMKSRRFMRAPPPEVFWSVAIVSSSLRAQRSNPEPPAVKPSLDCFVASAPRNDGCVPGSHAQRALASGWREATRGRIRVEARRFASAPQDDGGTGMATAYTPSETRPSAGPARGSARRSRAS